jgi:hypothetical protein
LFLDPSDTLRLWFSDYRQATRVFRGFRIRRAQSEADWQAINQLYHRARHVADRCHAADAASSGRPGVLARRR